MISYLLGADPEADVGQQDSGQHGEEAASPRVHQQHRAHPMVHLVRHESVKKLIGAPLAVRNDRLRLVPLHVVEVKTCINVTFQSRLAVARRKS